jgi:hypothetical protein
LLVPILITVALGANLDVVTAAFLYFDSVAARVLANNDVVAVAVSSAVVTPVPWTNLYVHLGIGWNRSKQCGFGDGSRRNTAWIVMGMMHGIAARHFRFQGSPLRAKRSHLLVTTGRSDGVRELPAAAAAKVRLEGFRMAPSFHFWDGQSATDAQAQCRHREVLSER